MALLHRHAPVERDDPAAPGRVVIRDRAGCLWIVATFFLAGGIAVVSLLLSAGTDPAPTGWARLAVWTIAAAHIAVGAWFLISTPLIRTRLDASERTLTLTRCRLVWRRHRRIHISEILEVVTRVDRDQDGDPVHSLELRLRTGERVPLHSVPIRGEDAIEAARARLRAWGGGKLVFHSRGDPVRAPD